MARKLYRSQREIKKTLVIKKSERKPAKRKNTTHKKGGGSLRLGGDGAEFRENDPCDFECGREGPQGFLP